MINTPDVPVLESEKGNYTNGMGGIDHYHSYIDMFNGECVQATSNKELLFTKQGSDNSEYGRYMDPGMIDGWSGS